MFEVETRRDAVVVAASAPVLVQGASHVMALLARLGLWAPLRRVTTVWARAVLRVLEVDARVTGVHHLPERPAVLLPLHEGFLDPPLLMTLGRPLRFIARDELFAWPALGRVLRHGEHLSVPRQPTLADHQRLLRQAKAVIAGGNDLVVFPQASLLGVEAAFAPGARRIAAATGAPIVPIVITGTHRVWEHPYGPRLRRGCRVDLTILPAESPEIDRDAWRALERRMKAQALAATDAPVRRYVPERDGWWDEYEIAIDPDFTELAAAVAERRSGQRRRQSLGIVGADEKALP